VVVEREQRKVVVEGSGEKVVVEREQRKVLVEGSREKVVVEREQRKAVITLREPDTIIRHNWRLVIGLRLTSIVTLKMAAPFFLKSIEQL
jgi:hypothetical protein